MKKICFIGYGLRSETMMKAFTNIDADIQVTGITDPRAEEVRAKTEGDRRFLTTHYYENACEMLDTEKPDGVFIGTRCSLHTPYACEVLKRDIPLFLEKPVCITGEQYRQLKEAGRGKEKQVVVSFPLRCSQIVQEMRRIVESGVLGRIVMVQSNNNVPYGSVYYHSWYRDPVQTGGLFLQKTTHDIDFISYIMGENPDHVYAQTAKNWFKGDHPAGLHCPDCPEYRSCRESSYTVERIQHEEVQGDACAFAVDTGNEDMASAMFTTPNGAIISYNQCFLVKKSAARRGGRFIGTDGSAEFDFYDGQIREDRYLTAQTAYHQFDKGGQHFGGDDLLAVDFMNVLSGKPALSDLTAGLNSAAACLAAKRSAETGERVKIGY